MKEIELKVEGMTCEGCEKRIQNVLMDIDGVENAKASHTVKNIKITLNKDININTLKEAIEDLDFKVVE